MEQFKILTDLRDYIKTLEEQKGRVLARPTPNGGSPVFYRETDVREGTTLVRGIQVGDYCFSSCLNWVEPHNQMGLRFSANWNHLKGIYKLKSVKNIGKSVDVYWVLEKADIPTDLKFVPDNKDDRHYFLTVTKKMTVDDLVKKLQWVADRMTVIRDVSKVFK